jgi:hypothetical protein
MHFESTSYPLDCPKPVWQALREAQDTDRNINDEIVLAIASHVDSQDVDLEAAQRDAVETIVQEWS